MKTLLSDTFEQLAELGQSTAKKTTQAITQTFSPSKLLEQAGVAASGKDQTFEQLEKNKGKKQNSTPLDFNKLQKSFEGNEKQKMDILRTQLFQRVKSGDERILGENKQKKEQEKQMEMYQQQKQKKEQEEKKRIAEQEEPRGKIRKNIFSRKKAAQQMHAEVKPSSGKH